MIKIYIKRVIFIVVVYDAFRLFVFITGIM